MYNEDVWLECGPRWQSSWADGERWWSRWSQSQWLSSWMEYQWNCSLTFTAACTCIHVCFRMHFCTFLLTCSGHTESNPKVILYPYKKKWISISRGQVVWLFDYCGLKCNDILQFDKWEKEKRETTSTTSRWSIPPSPVLSDSKTSLQHYSQNHNIKEDQNSS